MTMSVRSSIYVMTQNCDIDMFMILNIVKYSIWTAMQENWSSGFLTRSDKNWPVHLQKIIGSLKFQI